MSTHMMLLYIIGGVLVVGGLLLLLLWLRFRQQKDIAPSVDVHQAWRMVEHTIKKPQALNLKLAIIEADELVDGVFEMLNVPGGTTDERWHNATYRYPKLRHSIWIHKLRTELEHDQQYPLKYTVAMRVLHQYKTVLQQLHVW